jgi:hypothetical protein
MPEAAQKRYLVHIKSPKEQKRMSRRRDTRGIIGDHPESRKKVNAVAKESHS